jgi:hypothetical protein
LRCLKTIRMVMAHDDGYDSNTGAKVG